MVSNLEIAFQNYFRLMYPELPQPESDYAFAAAHVGHGKGVRQRLKQARMKNWRADFAWPDQRILVEIEGGQWKIIRRKDGTTAYGGRHNTPEGYRGDCLKYNAAATIGYVVFRYTGEMLEEDTPFVLEQVAQAVRSRMVSDD